MNSWWKRIDTFCITDILENISKRRWLAKWNGKGRCQVQDWRWERDKSWLKSTWKEPTHVQNARTI